MAGKMVVHVTEDLAPLFRIWPQDTHPRLQIARTVDLDTRVVDDALIHAHPPNVQKVGRGTRRELHHLLPLDPAAVAQCQRDVVLSQQREHAVVNPAPLAKLDGKANVPWQLREKLRDGGQLRRPEVRTELNENWPKLW